MKGKLVARRTGKPTGQIGKLVTTVRKPIVVPKNKIRNTA